MAALFVYLQNTVARLRERQEGQTMAEYALILGGIAIVVILAIVFRGGKIDELFRATGSSVTNPVSSHRSSTPAGRDHRCSRPAFPWSGGAGFVPRPSAHEQQAWRLIRPQV